MKGDKLTVAFMNVHGQSNFAVSKQLQIQDYLCLYEIDILACKEVSIVNDTCNILRRNDHFKSRLIPTDITGS